MVDRYTVVEMDTRRVSNRAKSDTDVTRNCSLLACRIKVHLVPGYGVEVDHGSRADTEIALDISLRKGVRPSDGNSYDAAEVRTNLEIRNDLIKCRIYNT